MKPGRPKLDYASPSRAPEPREEKSELQQALSFVGLMFIAVAAFNVLTSLRHGPNLLAVLIGFFGIALFVCSRVVKR